MTLARTLRPRPDSLRRGGDLALRRSPLQPLARAANARRLAVLAYHGVDDPAGFERQLDLLARRMHPVSLDDVLRALAGEPLPSAAVLVTFDDGHPSVLTDGAPLLRARGIPAVAFVCPGLVGTHQPFWWTEVETLYAAGARRRGRARAGVRLGRRPGGLAEDGARPAAPRGPGRAAGGGSVGARHGRRSSRRPTSARLRDAGVEVGNHTWSHPCLDRCADGEPERQVERAHDRLTELLGAAPRAFAYPNGNHDPRAEAVLTRLGYAAGFLFDHRLAQVSGSGTHPLRLSRLRVSTTTSRGPLRPDPQRAARRPAPTARRGVTWPSPWSSAPPPRSCPSPTSGGSSSPPRPGRRTS